MRRQGRGWGTCAPAAVAVALLTPAAAHAAPEPVFEKYAVPTVDGAEINVEVMRPAGAEDAPVVLTYSPYNTLSETTSPNLANDDLGQHFLEQGYARAVADVLGTRNSSGCWDYGGANEQQSGVDLVNFLSEQPWSNGRVGMIGGSYDGTTANMVAARGDDAPGLKAIVPIAAISRWYGYAYSHGIRYFLNSEVPSDEGFDTPLAFDFGLTRTPPTDPADPKFGEKLGSRADPCDSGEHTERGYDESPDYDDFWLERDYRKDARRFRAAVLVAHGWQDWNVKQEEGVELFKALRVPLKKLYMFQDSHSSPSADNWEPLLDRFFERTLRGVRNGIERDPQVLTEGRTAEEGSTGFRSERSWPPSGNRALRLGLEDENTLARGGKLGEPESYTDSGTVAEERSKQDPSAEGEWLWYASEPLQRDIRLAGSAALRLTMELSREHGDLTPVLVDVPAEGEGKTVSRGFLDLRYRDGLGSESAVPVDEPFAARVSFKPQDHTFEEGHRIGVLLQSSNVVWAMPDDPGAEVTVHSGRLDLPVARP